MKKYLAYPLVVEGKEDASYLSSYIDSEIVVVNGFELLKQTIEYLKTKTVIALLDPDEAGKQIRQKINKELPNVINIEIDINKCIRGKKKGVAECEITEILDKLKPYVIEKEVNWGTISNTDLYNLGLLENKELRKYVCEQLKLGKCNNKQLLNRLSINNIDLNIVKKIVEEYQNGN